MRSIYNARTLLPPPVPLFIPHSSILSCGLMQSSNSSTIYSRSASIETYVDDSATASCIYKHCFIRTAGSNQQTADFYMRQHMRAAAQNGMTESHWGCQSSLKHPDSNPFYLMEEYCGISLGRDVERMIAINAEQVSHSFQF
jgi:hypothetical protein